MIIYGSIFVCSGRAHFPSVSAHDGSPLSLPIVGRALADGSYWMSGELIDIDTVSLAVLHCQPSEIAHTQRVFVNLGPSGTSTSGFKVRGHSSGQVEGVLVALQNRTAILVGATSAGLISSISEDRTALDDLSSLPLNGTASETFRSPAPIKPVPDRELEVYPESAEQTRAKSEPDPEPTRETEPEIPEDKSKGNPLDEPAEIVPVSASQPVANGGSRGSSSFVFGADRVSRFRKQRGGSAGGGDNYGDSTRPETHSQKSKKEESSEGQKTSDNSLSIDDLEDAIT